MACEKTKHNRTGQRTSQPTSNRKKTKMRGTPRAANSEWPRTAPGAGKQACHGARARGHALARTLLTPTSRICRPYSAIFSIGRGLPGVLYFLSQVKIGFA